MPSMTKGSMTRSRSPSSPRTTGMLEELGEDYVEEQRDHRAHILQQKGNYDLHYNHDPFSMQKEYYEYGKHKDVVKEDDSDSGD